MKTEKWLTENLRNSINRWSHQRCFTFEACGAPGVPDLYCVRRGCPALWVEAKVQASQDCQVPFRPQQPGWLDNHHRAGGLAFIVIWVEAESTVVVLRGSQIRLLASKKLKDAGRWKLAEIPFTGRRTWEDVLEVFYGA